jgi:hypothetical protein
VVYDSIRAFLSISPSSSEEVDELPEQDDNCKIFARRNKVMMYFFIRNDNIFFEIKQAAKNEANPTKGKDSKGNRWNKSFYDN